MSYCKKKGIEPTVCYCLACEYCLPPAERIGGRMCENEIMDKQKDGDMKQTEEIKAMIREMMNQEMENFKEAVSNGEAEETASPVVYGMLQVLMARIEAMPKVWHKPDEEPDRTREPILRLHRDMSAGTLFFSMMKSEEEVQMMMEGIVAWCYFEDLLPQWIKVYDYDKLNTKKGVIRDDELDSNMTKED